MIIKNLTTEVCHEKNKVKPHRIIQTIQENFKDVLTKPNLKNLGLISLDFIKHIMLGGKRIIFILYEKSGYRWSKYYNTSSRKEYSLIRVIKEKLRNSWINLRLDPLFALNYVCFYEV